MTSLEEIMREVRSAQRETGVSQANAAGLEGLRDALQAMSRGQPADSAKLETGLLAIRAHLTAPGAGAPSTWRCLRQPSFGALSDDEPGGAIYQFYEMDGAGEVSVYLDASGAPYLASLAAPGADEVPDTYVLDLRQRGGQWHLRVGESIDELHELPMPASVAALGWTEAPQGVAAEGTEGIDALLSGAAAMIGAAATIASQTMRRQHDAPKPPQPPTRKGWWLTVTSGPDAGRTLPLTGALVLGSDAGADVVLTEAHVSPRHAHLALTEEGRPWLADLGSERGTTLNDQPATGSVWLGPGDVVRVGETSLTLTWHGSD